MLSRDKSINLLIKNENNEIEINELSFIKKINLRLNPDNKEQVSSCSKILNILLPTKTNTFVCKESSKII